MPRFAQYGYSRQHFALTVPLAGFLSVTTQQTLVLSLPLGFQFEIEKLFLIPTIAATGAGASRVINVRKGTATGTVVATATATLANGGLGVAPTAGTVTSTAKTNVFQDADTLTVEFPTGGTVFTAGQYDLVLQLRCLAQRVA